MSGLWATLLLIALGVAPSNAVGAEVAYQTDDSKIVYSGDQSIDDIEIASVGSMIEIRDRAGRAIVDNDGSGGCETGGPIAHCPLPSGLTINLEAGDDRLDMERLIPPSPQGEESYARVGGDGGNDTLLGSPGSDDMDGDSGDDVLEGRGGDDDLDGGPYSKGSDVIDGGDGDDDLSDGDASTRDRFSGGPGKDAIYASDAARDQVDCGAGKDKASLDSRDPPPAGCETDTGFGPSIEVDGDRSKATVNGTVRVRVRCDASGPCEGRLALKARRGGRLVTLAVGLFKVPDKYLHGLDLRLTKDGRRLLGPGKGGVKGVLVVTGRDAGGKATTVKRPLEVARAIGRFR